MNEAAKIKKVKKIKKKPKEGKKVKKGLIKPTNIWLECNIWQFREPKSK